MATRLELYNLRFTATTLKSRVASAIAKAAQDVLNESDQTENHANRIVWARAGLNDARAMAERMMWGVLGNATIASEGDASTDNDVQFVVNSLINTFAVAEV